MERSPFPIFEGGGVITDIQADAFERSGVGDDTIIEIIEPVGAEALNAHAITGAYPGHGGDRFVSPNDTTEGRRRCADAGKPQNEVDVVRHNDKLIKSRA